MRNLFLSFLLTLFIPVSSWAISISEIQSNPDRYVQMSENAQSSWYLDVNSISSLRYSPPYYTLQSDVYIIKYTNDYITKYVCVFNYDYGRSFDSIGTEMIKNYSDKSAKQLAEIIQAEIEKDTGVLFSVSKGEFYRFDGQYIGDDNPFIQAKKVPLYSPAFHTANYVFNKYYDMPFVPDF